MKILTILFSIFMLITITLIMLNILMTSAFIQSREKASPFECGFNPMSPSRYPFSLQFFMIALIFLVFDIEITLILPIPMAMDMINSPSLLLITLLFLLIIILGLFLEWKNGVLKWTN